MSKRVYVAGPYSAPTLSDREDNVWKACKVARQVMKLGYTPFVPHTSHYIDPDNDQFSWERWMEWCLEWLEECDILLVTGLSKGVRVEIDFALKHRIPIIWSLAELEWRHEKEQSQNDPAGLQEREVEPAGANQPDPRFYAVTTNIQTAEGAAAAAPAAEETTPVVKPRPRPLFLGNIA